MLVWLYKIKLTDYQSQIILRVEGFRGLEAVESLNCVIVELGCLGV